MLRETGENVAVKVRGLFALPVNVTLSWRTLSPLIIFFVETTCYIFWSFYVSITAVYTSSPGAAVFIDFSAVVCRPSVHFSPRFGVVILCVCMWSDCMTKCLFAISPRQSGSIPRGGTGHDVGSPELESVGVVLAEV